MCDMRLKDIFYCFKLNFESHIVSKGFFSGYPHECCVNELSSQMEMFQKPLRKGLITLEKGNWKVCLCLGVCCIKFITNSTLPCIL